MDRQNPILVFVMLLVVKETFTTAAVSDVVSSTNEFALDMYRNIVRRESGNVFFSPLSISLGMGMVRAGARNTTYKQLTRVLHMDENRWASRTNAFGQLSNTLANITSDGQVTVRLANRLFGADKYTFLEPFLDKLLYNYHAHLQQVPFQTNSEVARRTINAWVQEQTMGNIRELLKPESIGVDTKLALINAIYFKGGWKIPFDKKNTYKAKFHAPNSTFSADTMHKLAKFAMKYNRKCNCQVVNLPYGNEGRMSMYLLLPDGDREALKKMEAELTAKTIIDIIEELVTPAKYNVQVVLPIFKLEQQLDLKSLLMSMGATDLFTSGRADLSGMVQDNLLYVSDAIHKAVIEVNEKGTEASAATGSMMTSRGIPATFRADRPFVFFIADNRSNAVVFMGRVTHPAEVEAPTEDYY